MTRMLFRLKPVHLVMCSALAALALSSVAQAQTIYRIVGPDGKVSFSDQPPASEAGTKKGMGSENSTGASAASSGASNARLPLVLRNAIGKYPVVLYSSKDCGPCTSGRNLLTNRGIPFSERTVENNESIEALRQLSGQSSLPLLTIGSQQIKGYSDANWTQYLNAAGYPEKSALPSNYQQASATPLAQANEAVATTNGKKPAKGNADAAPTVVETPVAPPSTNPSGIRF